MPAISSSIAAPKGSDEMKITAIKVYKSPLPYVDGAYHWGAGNVIEVAMASVVLIETDAGISGVSEFTPAVRIISKAIPKGLRQRYG